MGDAQSCLACDSKRQSVTSKRTAVDDKRVLATPESRVGTSERSSRPSSMRGDSEIGGIADKARVGIGAYFQRNKEQQDALQVKSLLKGSPAQLCNKVSIGDTIIAVNGESVYGKSLAELAEKLLGPSGSPVECSFEKGSTKEMYTVTLVRGINAERWSQNQ
mmetsp:Transcript_33513/g.69225  ORF Transcript_33513/g.69225 Transcript_33513/m.69225 type:complete len:162 (+) Transcript_33513:170-655(+)|eukprot:CAMPEP_0181316332 /NCGR_PEP_ID=MMETSP1101-20121128/15837_1 /TAXON_ID=46948 /ORGANISM="Rhodomonas abbreviata, Strain Caron Lab Isolate" /LENGTH=161 /DNA_ID=CAMNT_0023423569 /DNA_START=165 /DNA_END=650 /DNA_ORIENTATION=+